MSGQQALVALDAVLAFRRGGSVLLGKRRNTGHSDGCWQLPGGRVDAGESVFDAAVREALEETRVVLDAEQLHVSHVVHSVAEALARVVVVFEVWEWVGEPVNSEPDKCEGWVWFPVVGLPQPLVWSVPYATRQVVDRVGARFSVFRSGGGVGGVGG